MAPHSAVGTKQAPPSTLPAVPPSTNAVMKGNADCQEQNTVAEAQLWAGALYDSGTNGVQHHVTDDVQRFQRSTEESIPTDDIEDDDFTTGHSEALARKVGFQNGLYPETEEDLKKAEEVLSNELATISIDEHEEAMFDVVG
eukprot:CAMPEP_0168725408 /NCGR_PEP_ID=MMETSP0724-20121128/4138_1 /TAXON_ID=265536 /ORGANISM="Amphiprora sp., Strain CCMP467" /LENGTH=141 /DNA_ID=CAMNT_0008772191 /DNA_START=107 /DNA_END=528 /DNA_ORIENTATION=-